VQKGQAPGSTAPPGNSTPGGVAASGDPLSFQSQNLEALAAKRAGIEAAFGLRASKSNNWTDDQWLGFDRAEQEKIYVAKMTDLKQFPTVEKLKSLADISLIIEKFLWAQWVKQNAFSTPFMSDTKGQKSLSLSLGGNRESKFTQLGIDKAAGVTFHWYGNSPDDWQQKILDWAGGFSERLGS